MADTVVTNVDNSVLGLLKRLDTMACSTTLI